MTPDTHPRRDRLIQAGIIFLIAVMAWLPRGFGLDRFVATDEVAWLWRSANFYYALGQRDLAATDLNRSPGVVTMWVNTAAYMIEFPEYRGLGQGMLDKYSRLAELLAAHGVDPHDILVTGRTLMAVLNTALLALAFPFGRRLFGTVPALAGFLLIALDPYHIALTRLAHLDGPMASFMFLALLAFLAYLHAGRSRLALAVSAIAAGLAVLAKLPGFLLPPWVALVWLVAAWEQRRAEQSGNAAAAAKPEDAVRFWWRSLVRPGLTWAVVFALAVVAFFPAMWVTPVQSALKLTGAPFKLGRFAELRQKPPASDPQPEVESGDIEVVTGFRTRPLDYFTRYPEKYLWHASPLTLFGLAAAVITFWQRRKPFNGRATRRAVLGLALFVVMYTVLMTIPAKSSSKYYLPVYPVMSLIAGAGWYALAAWLAENLRSDLRRLVVPLSIGAVLLAQAAQALPVYPYYLPYLNPLLSFSEQARDSLSMGSGEGLDQAAKYLNRLPHVEDLWVMSWYGEGPFSYYFDGHTIPITVGSKPWDAQTIAGLKDVDYLVVYSNQWKRQIPGGLFPFLTDVNPEQRIYLNGIEYVRIYNLEALPAEKFILQP